MKIGNNMHFMLGAQAWTVELVPDEAWTGNEAGECLPLQCKIRIRIAHPDVMRDTLLHEILHAILSVTGVGDNKLHGEQEEDIVTALTPALDALLDWKVRGLK